VIRVVSLSAADLYARGLTPEKRSTVFVSSTWAPTHKVKGPSYQIGALPPLVYLEAAPKCISGRTSYLRARVDFLSYPQILPWLSQSTGSDLHSAAQTAELHPVHG